MGARASQCCDRVCGRRSVGLLEGERANESSGHSVGSEMRSQQESDEQRAREHANDIAKAKKELLKYAGAVAVFHSYQRIGQVDLDACNYWDPEDQDVRDARCALSVAASAKHAFDNAVSTRSEETPDELLAKGLARVVKRFLLVSNFKELVPMVLQAAKSDLDERIRRGQVVVADAAFSDCADMFVHTVALELQKVIEGSALPFPALRLRDVEEKGKEVPLIIKIRRATNLQPFKIINGDPWCKCMVKRPGKTDKDAPKCVTTRVKDSLTPVWNQSFVLKWWVGDPLEFTITSKGMLSKLGGYKEQGRVEIPCEKFYPYPWGFNGDVPCGSHAVLSVCINVASEDEESEARNMPSRDGTESVASYASCGEAQAAMAIRSEKGVFRPVAITEVAAPAADPESARLAPGTDPSTAGVSNGSSLASAVLADGWESAKDQGTGLVYYYNHDKHISQWEFPTA